MSDTIEVEVTIIGEEVTEYLKKAKYLTEEIVEINIYKLLNISNPDLEGLYVEYINWPNTFQYRLPRNIKTVERDDGKLSDHEIYALIQKYGTISYSEWVEHIYEINEQYIDTTAIRGYVFYFDDIENEVRHRYFNKIKPPFKITENMSSISFTLHGYIDLPYKFLRYLSMVFGDCEVFASIDYPNNSNAAVQIINGKIINAATTQISATYLIEPES